MKAIRLIQFIFPALLLAGCSRSDDGLPSDIQDGGPIKFEMGFAADDNPRSRVTTETDFSSTWRNNDKVGVYIVKGNGGLLASGNYADNVEFTYNNGTWTPSTPQYYPNDGDNLSFYAYYPYDADMTNPNAYTFNVPIDQAFNNGEYHTKNDFLWAKLENVTKSDNAVALQFSHALAMVQFYIGYSGLHTIIRINLNEAITDCTIDPYTQNISNGNTKNDILMWQRFGSFNGSKSHFTCWALVPPQTMDIRFAWEWQGTNYSATPASNVTLTGGKVHKYEIQ